MIQKRKSVLTLEKHDDANNIEEKPVINNKSKNSNDNNSVLAKEQPVKEAPVKNKSEKEVVIIKEPELAVKNIDSTYKRKFLFFTKLSSLMLTEARKIYDVNNTQLLEAALLQFIKSNNQEAYDNLLESIKKEAGDK